jgi:hypothetical protein
MDASAPTTELPFGRATLDKAAALEKLGRDPNQIAGILCDQDPEGHNFGIGIVIDRDGRPMPSSPTLLAYAARELETSKLGRYMNSADSMEELKARVLEFQRIPASYADHFSIATPSDAGSGAVKMGLELAFALDPARTAVGVEELGWPAYASMAAAMRAEYREFASDAVIDDPHVVPVYQAGPLNATGLVRDRNVNEARARAAARHGATVLLDRAYPGFEFARDLKTDSYDAILKKSHELQVQPYLHAGVPFLIALSPTKSFVSFALRPCGVLLAFSPDPVAKTACARQMGALLRARGSAFEHPLTRAFIKAFIEAPEALEGEHRSVLKRVADADADWRRQARGTPLEPLFGVRYAGLFRNPKVAPGAACHLYDKHLYPVLANGRCRLNVTGLSADREVAREHAKAFAEFCHE